MRIKLCSGVHRRSRIHFCLRLWESNHAVVHGVHGLQQLESIIIIVVAGVCVNYLLAEYPSCLQTTPASRSSHIRLQIVPHRPLEHFSTLPLMEAIVGPPPPPLPPPPPPLPPPIPIDGESISLIAFSVQTLVPINRVY